MTWLSLGVKRKKEILRKAKSHGRKRCCLQARCAKLLRAAGPVVCVRKCVRAASSPRGMVAADLAKVCARVWESRVFCAVVLCLRGRRFTWQGQVSEAFLTAGCKALNQKAGISGGKTIWLL